MTGHQPESCSCPPGGPMVTTGACLVHYRPLDLLKPAGCTCEVITSMTMRDDPACPIHGGMHGLGPTGPTAPLVEVGLDRTLELAHLLSIISAAADLLNQTGSDVDARILRAHGGELAAGREWPGMPIRSTIDQ